MTDIYWDDNGRVCTKCKVYKSWDNFNKNSYKNAPNQKQSSCRECVQTKQNKKRQEDSEKNQGITDEGKICECCEKFLPWSKFPKLNLTKKVQYPKYCLKCKREKAKECAERAKQADWYKWKARQLRTSWLGRAKKKGISKEDVPSISEIYEWLKELPMVCHYSGVPLDNELAQFDHKYALARGGSYDLNNVVVCTKEMNILKGNLLEEEFISLLKLMDTWEDKGQSLINTIKRAQYIWVR